MPAPAPIHQIQAIDIRVDEIRVLRRPRRDNEAELLQPSFFVPRPRVTVHGARSFVVSIRPRIRAALPGNEVWFASFVLSGHFVASLDIAPEDAQAFARQSGFFLLWPYARLHFSELAAMSRVEISPLPLVSRPRTVAVSRLPDL